MLLIAVGDKAGKRGNRWTSGAVRVKVSGRYGAVRLASLWGADRGQSRVARAGEYLGVGRYRVRQATLLNALIELLLDDERIVSLEDTLAGPIPRHQGIFDSASRDLHDGDE